MLASAGWTAASRAPCCWAQFGLVGDQFLLIGGGFLLVSLQIGFILPLDFLHLIAPCFEFLEIFGHRHAVRLIGGLFWFGWERRAGRLFTQRSRFLRWGLIECF